MFIVYKQVCIFCITISGFCFVSLLALYISATNLKFFHGIHCLDNIFMLRMALFTFANVENFMD
jgi:hypothetical protein